MLNASVERGRGSADPPATRVKASRLPGLHKAMLLPALFEQRLCVSFIGSDSTAFPLQAFLIVDS